MTDISQLILGMGLVALVGFLVLLLPLLYLVCGGLQPWFESMAAERVSDSDSGRLIVRSAPLARRSAARSSAPSRKLAVSPRPAKKSAMAKKTGAKKTGAKKKAVAKKRGVAKKVAKKVAVAKKKVAAKKAAVKKTAVAKKKVAAKVKSPGKKKVAAKRKSPAKKAAVAKTSLPVGAKLDAEFGVIYGKRPKLVDDLKKITGVGKVLEGKLQKAGIYTYRQIADWKVGQMGAFDTQFSFHGRIRRDGWKKQATDLIKAKRG
jgi:predicted flap endonuclease-1-like 5' DNA nuclease